MKKHPVNILIIEDDEDDYIIIKKLLADIETQDFAIVWSNTYKSATELLKENEWDICMLDYRLGAHDGLEILNELSDLELDIPVIFLTGQGEYSIDVKAMEAGAADYIVKDDLTSAVLERSIRYALERARSARELHKANEKLEERIQQRTSELVHANKELKKASKKIEMFAYSISHDLKSPATSLYALTRRLKDNYGKNLDTKGIKYCDQIMTASGQIVSLVENLNRFISEKEMHLNIQEIQLDNLLEEIRFEFSEKIDRRKIELNIPKDLPSIRADRLCIIRIFRNLVENALKYGGESLTFINIGFDENKNFYIISVADDGNGLIDAWNEDVFLPFKRTETAKSIEGSGLGLSIVKEIAKKHGGQVWAEQNKKKGAVFCFSISRNL